VIKDDDRDDFLSDLVHGRGSLHDVVTSRAMRTWCLVLVVGREVAARSDTKPPAEGSSSAVRAAAAARRDRARDLRRRQTSRNPADQGSPGRGRGSIRSCRSPPRRLGKWENVALVGGPKQVDVKSPIRDLSRARAGRLSRRRRAHPRSACSIPSRLAKHGKALASRRITCAKVRIKLATESGPRRARAGSGRR